MKRVLNLAPPSIRRRQAIRRMTRAVATAVTVAGVLSLGWLVLEWSRGASMARDLGRLEAEYSPLARLISEQSELRTSIGQLQAREQLSLRLTTSHAGVPILASIAKAAATPESEVHIAELEYSLPRAAGRNGRATKASPVVQIEGSGRDGLAVARFAQRLRETGLYAEVSIESSRPAGGDSKDLRRFEITCLF